MVKSKISIQLSYVIRFAYQTGGFRGKALLSLFPQCSRSLIYEHINRPLNEQQQVADKRKYNKGVTKITSQNERNIVRTVKRLRESDGTFTSRRVQLESGIGRKVCNRTVRRVLIMAVLQVKSLRILFEQNFHKHLKIVQIARVNYF